MSLTFRYFTCLLDKGHINVRMRGSSLLNPAITLHAIARNGFGNAKLRYFAAVSIEAPRYIGSLYDAILQNYKNLTPIEIRNVNRIMVDR